MSLSSKYAQVLRHRKDTEVNEVEQEQDGAPCCPDPECNGNPCTFPGYVRNN